MSPKIKKKIKMAFIALSVCRPQQSALQSFPWQTISIRSLSQPQQKHTGRAADEAHQTFKLTISITVYSRVPCLHMGYVGKWWWKNPFPVVYGILPKPRFELGTFRTEVRRTAYCATPSHQEDLFTFHFVLKCLSPEQKQMRMRPSNTMSCSVLYLSPYCTLFLLYCSH